MPDDRETEWMLAAVQRHAHEPDESLRARLIRRTFLAIREEAEFIALRLPTLEPDVARSLLDETVLEVLHELGYGCPDEILDAEVDLRFDRRVMAAREAHATKRTRAKLIQRRLERRHAHVSEDGSRRVREVATLIASEPDPATRARAERHASKRLGELG